MKRKITMDVSNIKDKIKAKIREAKDYGDRHMMTLDIQLAMCDYAVAGERSWIRIWWIDGHRVNVQSSLAGGPTEDVYLEGTLEELAEQAAKAWCDFLGG